MIFVVWYLLAYTHNQKFATYTCYLIHVTWYLLPDACYMMLATWWLVRDILYLLLVTGYRILVQNCVKWLLAVQNYHNCSQLFKFVEKSLNVHMDETCSNLFQMDPSEWFKIVQNGLVQNISKTLKIVKKFAPSRSSSIAKLIFNFNYVERWDGYILNFPSHPPPPTRPHPSGEVRNDLWNNTYN